MRQVLSVELREKQQVLSVQYQRDEEGSPQPPVSINRITRYQNATVSKKTPNVKLYCTVSVAMSDGRKY